MKKKIGLIVNPVAGMGGSVGLKGTDGRLFHKALSLGALPVTPARTKDVFEHIHTLDRVELYTAPGKMGADYIDGIVNNPVIVGEIPEETTSEHTRRIAESMIERGVELLIFVGGDGTARDVCDAVGLRIPVVAVPSGVKVFSAVFSYSARAAAEMVDAFIEGTDTVEQEVLDIDEEAFRNNTLTSKLYGSLFVPALKKFLQGGKERSSGTTTAAERKHDIAAFVVESMEAGALYLLGPGTTLKAVGDAVGIKKTLLGIDACADGTLVGSDVNEQAILALFDRFDRRYIVVTPIGGNGFIFGRGSKQLSPEVLRGVGKDHVLVVAEPEKLFKLDALRVDTGDEEVDGFLSGHMNVITGYNEFIKMEVKC